MSWPVVKLGEIATFVRNGASIKQSSTASGLKITRIETIAERVVNLDKCGYADLSEDDYQEYRLKRDDILISHINSEKHLGKCAIFEEKRNDIVHGMNLLCFRANGKVIPKFLYHFFSSGVFLAQLPRITKKSVNQASFTVTNFKELEIPLPPLGEQKRIAAILDKADAIRQKRKQAIELADEFLRSVFLDMFGDPVTNPKGWKVKPLSGLIAEGDKINYGIVQPGEHVDGGVPIVRVGDIADGKIDKSKLKCVLKEIDEKNKKSRLIGDEILITCVGATVGKVALADSSLQGFNTVRALTRVRLSNQVNRQFVFRYLQSPFVQNYFQMQLRTVGQPTLNGKQIGETPILLPEKDVQKSFLDIAEKLQSKIDAALAQLVNADDMFNSLSQKAFSGQL